MLKSRSTRLAIFLLLGLVLFVGLISSGPTGHAAPASIDSTGQAKYQTYMPVVSTQQWLTNCRYGVGNTSNQQSKQWMDYVGAGHYINFEARVYGRPLPDSIELLSQIRVKQDRKDGEFLPTYKVKPPLTMDANGLGPIILANPGALWLIGNEPDVDNDVQDRTMPEVYAHAYHEVVTFIKQIDPGAQVAVAGLSMMTPGRLQYLDIVWDTYQKDFGQPMPVDVWNTHLYILPEIDPVTGNYSDGKVALGTDPNLAKKSGLKPYEKDCPRDDVYCRAEHDDAGIFVDQIMALRTWMKAHGQQNKPLILSEYSLLYPYVIDYDDNGNQIGCYLSDEFGNCFTQPRVSNYLNKTADFLESAKDLKLGYPADDYRLVQQWTWYSMIVPNSLTGQSSDLLQPNYNNFPPGTDAGLTQVGRAFRDRARSSERTVNLVAGDAPTVTKTATGAATDVDLQVGYYNNGSTGVDDSFKVTFYKDAALKQVIGQAEISPGIDGMINGCSWGRTTDWASVQWTGLPVGTHTFWAKIDSHNQIKGETNEKDNVTSGQVVIKS